VLSSLGIFCFYRLAAQVFSKQVAFPAAMVLLTSIWFAYSRKIMPDTFSISLMLIGLYGCYKYCTEGKPVNIFIFLVCITFGMLCKLPAMLWMVPVFASLLYNAIPEQRRLAVLAAGSAALAITSAWYFYWVPNLVATYHYQLYFPKTISEGLQEISGHIPGLLKNFYFHALSSYVAFGCFLAGIVILFISSNKLVRWAILGMFLVFGIFIVKTGSVFPLHNYYIIPFVPFMALAAGFALSRIKPVYGYLLLLVISVEAILNQQHDFFIKDSERYKLSLEQFTDSVSKKTDLVIINGGQNPQLLYLAHRKGWTLSNSELQKKDTIEMLKHRGAEILIIDKKEDFSPEGQYPIVAENQYFKAFQLRTN
jgi:4-amino-4-deoxy-L-arabinose transferase-like glycosyltransferase